MCQFRLITSRPPSHEIVARLPNRDSRPLHSYAESVGMTGMTRGASRPLTGAEAQDDCPPSRPPATPGEPLKSISRQNPTSPGRSSQGDRSAGATKRADSMPHVALNHRSSARQAMLVEPGASSERSRFDCGIVNTQPEPCADQGRGTTWLGKAHSKAAGAAADVASGKILRGPNRDRSQ